MNKTQEALKMAIEQIKWAEHLHDWHDGLLDALKACEEVLAQPSTKNIMDSFNQMLEEKIVYYKNQKLFPTGYYYPDERSAYLLFQKGLEIPKDALPLYESFAISWQGLSDNEINQLYYSLKDINDFKDIIRVIEKKLKDKNI